MLIPAIINEKGISEDFLRGLFLKIDQEYHGKEWTDIHGTLNVGNLDRVSLAWYACGNSFGLEPLDHKSDISAAVNEIATNLRANNEGLNVKVHKFLSDYQLNLFFEA